MLKLLWMFGMLAAPADDPAPVTLPLKGLKAKCCEKPVEEALAAIPNVKSATLRANGKLYYADIVISGPRGVAMSEISKALAVADKEMGDAMGTKYFVDDSLSLSAAYLFRTEAEPNEGKLKSALGRLSGFKSVRAFKTGFTVLCEGAKIPTVADVKKACGVPVTDVLLAASKDGARYFCPSHPEATSLTKETCATCETDMIKILVTAGGKTTTEPAPTPDGGGKKKGG